MAEMDIVESTNGSKTPFAFLITQIGAPTSLERLWADSVERHVVRKALEPRGLTPYRSDRDFKPGPIGSQMVQQLAAAAVVIADLTGRNPNVFYELGIAHSLTKPVVVLIDDIASLPFDVVESRAILLHSVEGVLTADGAANALHDLNKTLDLVLQDGYKADSIVAQAGADNAYDSATPSAGDKSQRDMAILRREIENLGRTMEYGFDQLRRSSRRERQRNPIRDSNGLFQSVVDEMKSHDASRRLNEMTAALNSGTAPDGDELWWNEYAALQRLLNIG